MKTCLMEEGVDWGRLHSINKDLQIRINYSHMCYFLTYNRVRLDSIFTKSEAVQICV